uniref:Uncharacterized protein n=1 Tax=Glossina palpalis gambiensis TaxID=67801 RepID=A0A1B0AS16_9MUSC
MLYIFREFAIIFSITVRLTDGSEACKSIVLNALSTHFWSNHNQQDTARSLVSHCQTGICSYDGRLKADIPKFVTLPSEVDALKERAAIQQVGIEYNAPKFQTPIIDDASNVLCAESPKRQNKNKRPKATARKCYNFDKAGHKACECKFRRKDLILHTNNKAGVQRKCHIKGYKSTKFPDDSGGQKHVEKTVITEDLKDNRMPEEQNAKENIVVDDIRNAQLAANDLKLIIAAKKGEHVGNEQIDKESAIAKAYSAQWESLVFEDGCLWRTWYSKNCSHKRRLLKSQKSIIKVQAENTLAL